MQVLYDGRVRRRHGRARAGEYSYSFGGLVGSLDHVLLNGRALEPVTGADIWEINARSPIALEYSRYNYHGTLFYDDDPFRSSRPRPGDRRARPAAPRPSQLRRPHARWTSTTSTAASTPTP